MINILLYLVYLSFPLCQFILNKNPGAIASSPYSGNDKSFASGVYFVMKQMVNPGETNHYLTIVREIAPRVFFRKSRNWMDKSRRIECICKCGKVVQVELRHFKNGHTKSCGSCWFKALGVSKTHGLSKHPLYRTWHHMMGRCYDERDMSYKHYGARGVVVCDEWKGDFIAFYEWGIKNGWAVGLELDKDIIGTGYLYSPSTCCFVTSKVNNNNKRNNVYVIYEGKKTRISYISDMLGVSYKKVYKLYWGGNSIEQIIKKCKQIK